MNHRWERRHVVLLPDTGALGGFNICRGPFANQLWGGCEAVLLKFCPTVYIHILNSSVKKQPLFSLFFLFIKVVFVFSSGLFEYLLLELLRFWIRCIKSHQCDHFWYLKHLSLYCRGPKQPSMSYCLPLWVLLHLSSTGDEGLSCLLLSLPYSKRQLWFVVVVVYF